MAYQTGVSSTLNDLISSMLTFAQANGFGVGASWTYTTGSGVNLVTWDVVSLTKSGIFFNFAMPRSGTTYLQMNTSSAQTAGALTAQPFSASNDCRADNLAGPHVGYHFFCDGLSLHVCVEIVTNVFVHFSFGEMVKNGSWVGGQYMTALAISSIVALSLNDPFITNNQIPWDGTSVGVGSSSNSGQQGHVRTPINGPVIPLARGGTVHKAFATVFAANAGRDLITYSPNAFNGRSVLVPINIVQASNINAGPFYQLGTIGNARGVNIANLNPKETVNTDWMVFPISQKNGPGTTYLNSQNIGLAYRK